MKKPVFSVPAPLFAPQSAGVFAKMNEKKLQLITDFDACLGRYFFQKGKSKSSSHSSLSEVQIQLLNYLSQQGDSSLEDFLPSC